MIAIQLTMSYGATKTSYCYVIIHLTALEYRVRAWTEQFTVSLKSISTSPSVYERILLLWHYSLGIPSTHCCFFNRTMYLLTFIYAWEKCPEYSSNYSVFLWFQLYLLPATFIKSHSETQCFKWRTEWCKSRVTDVCMENNIIVNK